MEYENKRIAEVKNLPNGDKQLHFFGYSYEWDGEYTFIEYIGFIVNYSTILKSGYSIEEYENIYGGDEKQCYIPVSAKQLKEIYEHYDNGRCPKMVDTINENTPDGIYIF